MTGTLWYGRADDRQVGGGGGGGGGIEVGVGSNFMSY